MQRRPGRVRHPAEACRASASWLSSGRMTPAAAPASKLVGGLWVFGFVCVAVVTWWNPSATRMYAWPWSLALAGALLAPVLILILRSLDARQILTLPATPWLIASLAAS